MTKEKWMFVTQVTWLNTVLVEYLHLHYTEMRHGVGMPPEISLWLCLLSSSSLKV